MLEAEVEERIWLEREAVLGADFGEGVGEGLRAAGGGEEEQAGEEALHGDDQLPESEAAAECASVRRCGGMVVAVHRGNSFGIAGE